MLPLRRPVAVGVNVTFTAQVPPLAATGAVQVLVPPAKSPESPPPIEKPPTVSDAPPVLVSVIVAGAEAVPCFCAVKTTGFGVNETTATAALFAMPLIARTRLLLESLTTRLAVVFGEAFGCSAKPKGPSK